MKRLPAIGVLLTWPAPIAEKSMFRTVVEAPLPRTALLSAACSPLLRGGYSARNIIGAAGL